MQLGPSRALTAESVSGMLINGIGIGLIQKIGGVVLTLYLVRIIGSEEYGAFGVAVAVVMLLMTFSVERFAEFSFHATDGENPRFERHLAVAVILHGIIFLLILASALLCSASAEYKPVAPLLYYGALAPLLNIPRIIYTVDLNRRLDWRRLRLLGLASFAFATLICLALASLGLGALALMSQVVITPVPYVIHMLLVRRDLFRLTFDLKGYGAAFNFGSYRTAGAALSRSRETVESFMVSAAVGLAGLGIYGRAVGLTQLTSCWLAMQLTAIIYPILSKLNPRTAVYSRAAALSLRLCVWSSLPLAVSIGALHIDAINVIYGEQWLAAIPFIRPLLIVAVGSALLGGLHVIALTSVGVRLVFISQALAFALALVGLASVLPISLSGYAWYLAMVMCFQVFFVAVRLIGADVLDVCDMMRAMVAPATLAAGAFIAVQFGMPVLISQNVPAGIRLLGAFLVVVLALAILVRIFDGKALDESVRFLPRVLQHPTRTIFGLADPSPRAAEG